MWNIQFGDRERHECAWDGVSFRKSIWQGMRCSSGSFGLVLIPTGLAESWHYSFCHRKFLCNLLVVDQVTVVRFMLQQRKQRRSLAGGDFSLLPMKQNFPSCLEKGACISCPNLPSHPLSLNCALTGMTFQGEVQYRGYVSRPVELGQKESVWISRSSRGRFYTEIWSSE